MGKKLVAYYDNASKIGGARAKIDLIKFTCLSVSQAESMPDSEDLIKKYDDALKEITDKYEN